MSEQDPFTKVYDALWTLAERNEYIKEVIRKGNRLKYDKENSNKPRITDGDLPELALLTTGMQFPNDMTDCSNRGVRRNYSWSIATGSYEIQPTYNKLCFELFRAMVDWQCVLCELTWCNCGFVQNCRQVQVEEGLLMDQLNRGIEGWSAIWTCSVDFSFPFDKLRLNANQNTD